MPDEKRHPIQVVVRRTGLTPELLRIWEKRYGLVEPGRTETGRRVYSDEDIERLRLVRRVTQSGRRVGEVSELSTPALEALAREDERNQDPKPSGEPVGSSVAKGGAVAPVASPVVEDCMAAIRDLDALGLEGMLNRSLLTQGSIGFIEEIVSPLARTIGEHWEAGRLDAYSEHLATGVIRQVVTRIFAWAHPDPAAPVLIVTTPAGQRHEIGAILAAATAQTDAWTVLFLGSDLPARDIARAAEQARAAAVALSIVYPYDDSALKAELSDLHRRLPKDVSLFIGGAAADSYARTIRRIGGEILPDLSRFRTALAKVRAERGGTRAASRRPAAGVRR